MKHLYFEIKNFKGIESMRIEFDSHPRNNVYTLVGLNESGKTTVLEAIDFLSYKTETLGPLNLPGYSVKNVHELIPISKRSNFNDKIVIKAGFEADETDNEKIRKHMLNLKGFELTNKIETFEIKQVYSFKNSQLLEGQPENIWTIELKGKRRKSRKIKTLKAQDEDWQAAVKYIRRLTPSILYFPNFLFEFPEKIYLEETPQESDKHAIYRTVLQDVLDAIGDNTSIDVHILGRAKANTRYEKQALDSVLLNMGAHITKTVFKNWDQIFKRPASNKEIVVRYDKDEEGGWFLELRLKDANEYYAIRERSLGFRWFFTFLLLTQYRGFRKTESNSVLFLLDEPASNLHSSAQKQLLKSFGNFPGNCSIIYTTHSHHMINPVWLENTYVVKNEGLNYEVNEDSYNAKNTLVTLHKYRTFAIQHPNQTTYFQPILDVLDYSPSDLESVPNVVMVEGKNDFYTLKYFNDRILNNEQKLNLLPGNGAGSLDNVIQLYLAWGRKFIVLLDSDKAGTGQKQRYKGLFGALVQGRIFSLEDVEPTWKRKDLEKLVSSADQHLIQNTVYPGATRFNKTHFNRSVQELYLTNRQLALSTDTKANFKKIIDFCSVQLQSWLASSHARINPPARSAFKIIAEDNDERDAIAGSGRMSPMQSQRSSRGIERP